MVNRRTWVLQFFLFALVYGVNGQTSNATCISNSTTSWLFDSEGHSPCIVWSRLQSLCLPATSFLNVPPLLDPSWSYNLPSGETSCQCNVISYALMAGCTWCQNGNNGNWAEEWQWMNVCQGRYTADGLGFAQSVAVLPAYAWKGWNGGRWSPAEASASASLFVSSTPTGSITLSRSLPAVSTSASPPSTETRPNVSSTSPPSSLTSTSPGSSSPSEEKTPASKWGPIVGGIAGGIIALVLLFFLIRHLTRKNKEDQDPPSIVPYKESNSKSRASRASRGSRSGSFLNVLGGYPSPRGGRDRDMKRETELITDPMSFATPRPAPKAPGSVHLSKNRDHDQSRFHDEAPMASAGLFGKGKKGKGMSKKGDKVKAAGTKEDIQDKLRVRNGGVAEGSEGEDSDTTLVFPPRNFSRNNSDDSLSLSSARFHPRSAQGNYTIATPRTPGHHQDFSQPRPYSEIGTLPSLYEPPTGAPTFRGTMHSGYTDSTSAGGIRPETLLSPRSQYPGTERFSRSTMGKAEGENGEYWSRQALPPLPREGDENAKRRK